MRPEDREREAFCFDLLRELASREVLLIGGYAVSAYGPPRFSADLDLVLPRKEVTACRRILRRRGLAAVASWDGGGVFAGRSERWATERGGVSVAADLLIDGVSDRVSGAKHTYGELRRGAERKVLRGLDPALAVEALVPARETLIALKLEVGRMVDLRDVAVLAGAEVDADRVLEQLATPSLDVVMGHVQALESALAGRAFRDSLKGVYMLDDRAYARYRDGAHRLCLELTKRLRRIGG